jgi:hypothetical protein
MERFGRESRRYRERSRRSREREGAERRRKRRGEGEEATAINDERGNGIPRSKQLLGEEEERRR